MRSANHSQSDRQCTVELTVPFHDLDPMQVVWHGNYLKYFELARQKLFDDSGVDLYRFAHDTGYLFPIVKTTIKYVHALRFRDRIGVTARLLESRRRIVVDFRIVRLSDQKLCARATSEQVAIRASDMALQLTIPQAIRSALTGA